MAESDAEREARLVREVLERAAAERLAGLPQRMERDRQEAEREQAEREAAERRAQGNGNG